MKDIVTVATLLPFIAINFAGRVKREDGTSQTRFSGFFPEWRVCQLFFVTVGFKGKGVSFSLLASSGF